MAENKTKKVRRKAQGSSELSVYKTSAEESVRHKTSKGSSIYKGSEEYFGYTCDPCSTVGDHEEAKGFCTNCGDYLRGKCYRSHSRNRVSRDYILLDKDNMPKRSVLFCDPCKTAGDEEETVGYCKDCDEYLCSTCYRSHSRSSLSKHHVLLDKDNVPRKKETLASAVDKQDAAFQNFVEEYTFIRNINVTSADDEDKCLIFSMSIVSNNELVLADQNNKSVKLVNVENGVVKNSLKLESEPGGVTMLDQDHVAVVLWNKRKINIVSVSGGLNVLRTLNTDGTCLNIKYINGKMYVSIYKPVKFQILLTTGAVYKTIQPHPEVLKYCTLPSYIAVSRDESLIYISDKKTNNVFCIDMKRKMVAKFNGELDKPNDIIIFTAGSVYVCNRRQHEMYKMTPDLQEAIVILGRRDGLSFPTTMCFNTGKKLFYISSANPKTQYCNFIKVYSWK